jgi:hypothetical protein
MESAINARSPEFEIFPGDIRKYDATIRYYTRREPDDLTDDQWATLINDIEWVRNEERIHSLNQIPRLAQ